MVKVEACGRTDVGKVRTHNEDGFLMADLSQGLRRDTPEPLSFTMGKLGGLFVTSDGVGGAAAGEVASELSLTASYNYLQQKLNGSADLSGDDLAEQIEEAIHYANALVHEKSRDNLKWRGMAATLTAALVQKDNLLVGQIGDSRAYLIRRGEITQLTKDQSLVQQMIDAGELSEEEGKTFPRRNLLLQALGVNPTVEVIVTQYKLYDGDCLVLCTDGLHGLVSLQEIKSVVENSPDLPQVCTWLIEAANERGGTDNITVVLVKFSGDDLAQPSRDDKVVYAKFKKSKATQATPINSPEANKPSAPSRALRSAPPVKGAEGKIYLYMVIFSIIALLGISLGLLQRINSRGAHPSEVVKRDSQKERPLGNPRSTEKPADRAAPLIDNNTLSNINPPPSRMPSAVPGSTSRASEDLEAKVERLIRKARSAYGNERYIFPQKDNALEYCQQIMGLDPDNEEALAIKKSMADHFRNLAEKFWQNSEWRKARAHYQFVLKIDPTDMEATRRLKELEGKN